VLPLTKTGSDHVPCVVMINTSIPKSKLFRFENYWVEMPGFTDFVANAWKKLSRKSYSSAILADKLKGLRAEFKKW
jgi:hypothetical protein